MSQPDTLPARDHSLPPSESIPPAPLPEFRLLPAFVPLGGFLALLGLSAVLGAVHGHPAADLSLGPFAVLVGALSLLARPAVALLLAGCAWLDYDGFVADRNGTLTWHGTADTVRVLVLIGVALAALVVRRVWRAGR
jgi:hypothetical protein